MNVCSIEDIGTVVSIRNIATDAEVFNYGIFFCSAPAAAAERLETLYMEKQYVHKQQLESISTEDKYASNVRSFFCSSDSSTGRFIRNFRDCHF